MPKLICAEVNEIFRNLCRSSPVPKFVYPHGKNSPDSASSIYDTDFDLSWITLVIFSDRFKFSLPVSRLFHLTEDDLKDESVFVLFIYLFFNQTTISPSVLFLLFLNSELYPELIHIKENYLGTLEAVILWRRMKKSIKILKSLNWRIRMNL